MSERYGDCPTCNGTGYLMKRDLVLLVSIKIECSRCGGTGFNGDSLAREAKIVIEA